MRIRRVNRFLIAYCLALILLAIVGYSLSDYTIRSQQAQDALSHKQFVTDVGFLSLPRMSMTISSGSGESGRLRLDVSLEVEQKNLAQLEDFQPRINDKLVSFVRKLDMDDMRKPEALPELRKELLRQVNSVSYPVPVMDIVFRQFIIM